MASFDDVVIISGCRTAVGKFQGSLSDVSAPQLGAIAVREAVKRAGIAPTEIDECIMGNVLSAGLVATAHLGAIAVREAVKRAGIAPTEIDECIMGNVLSAGLGQNPAR